MSDTSRNPKVEPKTPAEWFRYIDALPETSLKYTLFQAFCAGRLPEKKAETINTPDVFPPTAPNSTRCGRHWRR